MKANDRSGLVLRRTLVSFLLLAAFLQNANSAEPSAIAESWFAIHEEGLQWLGMRNNGKLANPDAVPYNLPALEYPGGSLNMFLFSGGLWVGGLRDGTPIVSTCIDGDNGTSEYGPLEYATDEDLDDPGVGSLGWLEKTTDPVTAEDQEDRKIHGRYPSTVGRSYLGIGRRGIDDDGDGLVDEDPAGDISRDYIDNDGDGLFDDADPDFDGDAVVGSLDDDGDGLHDEDDLAVAGQELITAYVDTCAMCLEAADVDGFVPLGARVVQHTYQFKDSYADDFIIFDFGVTNIGEGMLEDVCIGMFFDPDILHLTSASGYGVWEDEFAYFAPEAELAIQMNDDFDEGLLAARFFGVRLIETPQPSPIISYKNYNWLWGERDPTDNAEKYALMASGEIGPDTAGPSDYRFVLATGPLGDLHPGESMNVAFAVVNGVAEEDLLLHARVAKNMWDKGFGGPGAPDPPDFTPAPGNHQVTVRWKADSERCLDRLTEKSDFQGYNIWRTSDGEQWTLVQQYDLPDTIGLNAGWPPPESGEQGFDYEIADEGVMNGARLRYVVTAFDDGDNGDGIHTEQWDQLHEGMGILESSRGEDTQQMAVPAAEGQASGVVDGLYVVPNPYIGSSRLEQHDWSDDLGRIEFRGLPPECSIQIYTLAGDLVRKLKHDSGLSWESWDVRNDEGEEVAGGIYIYRVNTARNERIDKFLVVK